MVSKQTILMIPVMQRKNTAMKLMDSSPVKGASLGIIGTGPAMKNFAKLNDPAMQLTTKEKRLKDSGLNQSISQVNIPTVGEREEEIISSAKEIWH